MEDLSVYVSSAGLSPFFLALGFIIVTRKAETLTGMCHCGLCWARAGVRVCVCLCVIRRTRTDEGQTERHVSFIGSLWVLLFCFGGLAVLVHTVPPWPHMHWDMSALTSHWAPCSFLKLISQEIFLKHLNLKHLTLCWTLSAFNKLPVGKSQCTNVRTCTCINTRVHLCVGPSSAVKQGIPPLLRLSA